MTHADARAQTEASQLKALRALLRDARAHNAFYRPRLEAADLGEDVASLAEYSAKMPFTTKMDLVWDREEFPPYGSNLSRPLADYSRLCLSSGTTRGPLPWLDTAASWASMLDSWDRVYEASGVGTGAVIFFAFSFGPFLGFWTAFDSAVRRGNRAIPGGGLSSQARLQTMAAHGAEVLCCTPTYALRLGERYREQEDEEIRAYRLRKIIVAGEAGGSIPEVRERLSELWNGAEVHDHHGMTEVGPVTCELPGASGVLQVIEESYFAEVIDRETQEEVAPGERGELVLTTLARRDCPLLRYRTGDLVQKSFHPSPGSGEPVFCLEGGILGRVDEMVVVRGVNVYPTAVEKILRGFSEVAEFQVTETTRQSMAELEIAVEPAGPAPPDLAERIALELANAFTLRIPVRVVEKGALPRFEFKSKRWVKQ